MVSNRLRAKVSREFGTGADDIVRRLNELNLPLFGARDQEGIERVQAAVVIAAHGDLDRFGRLAALAEKDWRDVLVAAELADEDWRNRLVQALGPS